MMWACRAYVLDDWNMEVKKGENSFLENIKQDIDKITKEEDEILKKRISSHPLYGLLLQSHLSCLKVQFSISISLFLNYFALLK